MSISERVARKFSAYGTKEYPEWGVQAATAERIRLMSEVSPGNDHWRAVQDGEWRGPLDKEAKAIAKKIDRNIGKFGLSVREVYPDLGPSSGHVHVLMIELALEQEYSPLDLRKEVEKAL